MGSPTGRASPFIRSVSFAPTRLHVGLIVLASAACVLLLYPLNAVYSSSTSAVSLTASQLSRFHADIAKCQDFSRPPYWEEEREDVSAPKRSSNPRFRAKQGEASTVVLQNATVFDGESWIGAVDLVLEDGVIAEVVDAGLLKKEGLRKKDNVEYVDVGGLVVTPGLVDMHSHHGVGSFPALEGTDDTNEVGDRKNPLTPYVRVIDGINVHDPAVGIIVSGGVTTSLIIPGSANIIGGEGVVIKNVYPESNIIEDMLLEDFNSSSRIRWMKQACGENPMRVYSHTRMGLAHEMRHHLTAAKEVIRKQDAWCARATSGAEEERYQAAVEGLPEQLDLEFTTAMLRGQVRVNVHCYETMDVDAMLRHSQEFGYRITAFHHALDAWRLPGLLTSQGYNITQAMFAGEHSLYKKEAYQANFYAGAILAKSGVPVAYKSDHFVTNAKHLITHAQRAHTYNLTEDLALASVISVPATTLGLGDRIGFLREGYDADVVVWDSHPLSVGATPLQVYIDGARLYNFTEQHREEPHRESIEAYALPSQKKSVQPANHAIRTQNCQALQNAKEGTVVIQGIQNSLLPSNDITAAEAGKPLTAVFHDSKLACISSTEDCVYPNDAKIINLSDGHLTPGFITVTNGLGLEEIQQEPSTQDGNVPDVDPKKEENVNYAKYGIHFGSKLMRRAYEAGVTAAVTPPLPGTAVLRGVSTGFKTGGKSAIDGFLRDDVALHVQIGQSAKGTTTPTISSQLRDLKTLLLDHVADNSTTLYGKVANGDMILAVHVENRDDIAQIVKLKQEPVLSNARFTIIGGAEAWMVATELADAKIPVILSPWRCQPDQWESQRCLVGPPATISPLTVLADAGVRYAIAANEDSLVMDLPYEALWAAKVLKKKFDAEAISIVSGKVAEFLGVKEGLDDVVVWEGVPGNGGRVVGIFGPGAASELSCEL